MKEAAISILKDEMGVIPIEVTRFTNGYCHSVFDVKTETDRFVLRVTGKENQEYYRGSVKWLSELAALGVPVPHISKHGHYEDVFYTVLSLIPGNDLGEVYHTLTDSQKRGIVKALAAIQRKVAALPTSERFGYPHSGGDNAFASWPLYIKSLISRSRERIRQNGILNTDVCDAVEARMQAPYFTSIKPIPFLDDITTKNVMIHKGVLAGIVDVDEVCYGDPLNVIGLTNMALLSMEADTKYIDYWLDEINADEIQRKAVIFYTLLSCVDFMGEQGMRFANGCVVPYSQRKVDMLNAIYDDLLEVL